MSFNNTKTPLKNTTNKGRHFVIKMDRGKYVLTEEQEKSFCRLYPIRTNREMMTLFGMSFSTLQRLRRKFGLQKDMAIIHKKQAEIVKKICEENGYYDSLRGRSLPQSVHDGYKRYCEQHGSINERLTKEQRHKRALKAAKTREQNREKDKKRLERGFPQLTKEHLPQFIYTRKQAGYRNRAHRIYGYILGDYRERFGERYTIYYDELTQRSKAFEEGASRNGFVFKELEE